MLNTSFKTSLKFTLEVKGSLSQYHHKILPSFWVHSLCKFLNLFVESPKRCSSPPEQTIEHKIDFWWLSKLNSEFVKYYQLCFIDTYTTDFPNKNLGIFIFLLRTNNRLNTLQSSLKINGISISNLRKKQ